MSEIRVERPGKSLAILARDKIVELIEKKELVPGVKVPAEGEFARRLGVSRGILREAYRLLEEDEGTPKGRRAEAKASGTYSWSTENLIRYIIYYVRQSFPVAGFVLLKLLFVL